MDTRLFAIPDRFHLCPDCGEGCVGNLRCIPCQRFHDLALELYHAERANDLYASLPRETGLLPEAAQPQRRVPLLTWAGFSICLGSWALIALVVVALRWLR